MSAPVTAPARHSVASNSPLQVDPSDSAKFAPRSSQASRRQRRHSHRTRRGAIIVLTAFLLIFLIGMMAFAVDLGYITLVRTEIQIAADACAFAGAGAMVYGTSAAQTEVYNYLALNKVGGRNLSAPNAGIEFGNWDSNSRTFTASNQQPSAIRVTLSNNDQPLFFGKALGRNTFNTTGQAVAVYQPRDIALVLDYSASMCYDSQFRNIYLMGQSAVEANLLQIFQQLGSPTYGTMGFTPVSYGSTSTSNSTIKNYFKLNTTTYPFPDGSWDEYIDYVQTDSYVNSAGYRCRYGGMTFVNYLMAKNSAASQTPGLHNVSEQPLTALKDAVDVFLSYLTANSTDDRVSLSIYTYTDSTAILEQGLTKTFTLISSKVRGRQAGHYISGTNISACMTKGRLDLIANARPGAKKMMVLMTDGVVNMPTGNTSTDKALVISEANLAATAGIPIITISVGALADTALMQQVADITNGYAFVVPGGQPIAQVQAQLESAFGQVAGDRPLKLVQ